MIRALVALIFGVALANGELSPHHEYVDDLMKSGAIGIRLADNIFEDARLAVPDLIRKYRYPVEVHNVTTNDGYHLQMHRIPHGRDKNNVPGDRPIVFVMHGLLSSSADWVLMGPGCGLAYILAEEGYDVWMGNARGNHYSRRHDRYNPDALLSTKFWEFTWDEIGNIDIPAMIDYLTAHTGRDRLHYIGHSQGTTAFWVFASLNPEYNEKIISMHALAPVAYLANSASLFMRTLARFGNTLNSLASLIGMGEFMANSLMLTWAGHNICMDEVALQPICSSIMFLIGGWNPTQHNSTMLPVKLGHTPAGASVRQIHHYGQSINDKTFRRYDHGLLSNRLKYGSYRPPSYPLEKITAPVFLHYSDSDPLADVRDVNRLFRELGRPVGLFRVADPNFSHLDFMWGIDARSLVYDRVVNLIKATDS